MRDDDRFNYGVQHDAPPRGRARQHDRRLMWVVARGVALGVILAVAVILLLGLLAWGMADAVAGPPVCHDAPCSTYLPMVNPS